MTPLRIRAGVSMFEWFGESLNPGGRGSVEVRGRPVETVYLAFTVARFVLTLGLFVAAIVAATFWNGVNPLAGVIAGGGYLVYLFVGYFVRPKPDLGNLGLLGGLIDHPLRWSDDWNRTLLTLSILLAPGWLLASPVAELFAYIAGEADAR